jgi:prepilin-type N-terminal cleavage/methylation domain-containing protein
MRTGYTLVETIIVISVMAVIGSVAFVGLGAAREAEKLANAQKEMVADLRSLQNKALAGADGGTTVYKANPGRYSSWPTFQGINISMNSSLGSSDICFYNPNKSSVPFGCPSGTGVATITLTRNGNTKQIQVELVNGRVTVIKPL